MRFECDKSLGLVGIRAAVTGCGEGGPLLVSKLYRHWTGISPCPERGQMDDTKKGPRSSQGHGQGHGLLSIVAWGGKYLALQLLSLLAPGVLLLAYLLYSSIDSFLPFLLVASENAVDVFKIVWK